MALLLGGMALRQRDLARTGDSQREEALIRRELLSVLAFVLERSHPLSVPLDPRLEKYAELRRDQESERQREDILEILRQLLDQVGMPLDLERPQQEDKTESGEVPGTQVVSGNQGDLPQLYHPSLKEFLLPLGNREYTITIWPINARPNLNTLPLPALRRYLVYLGLAPAAAARLGGALTDWRDEDFFTAEAGAEFDAYGQAGYRPRNGLFRSWQEVYYVKGSGAPVVRLLRRHFVLHGGHLQVYTRYLPPEALAALAGVDRSQILGAFPELYGTPEGENWNVTSETRAAIRAVVTENADERLWLLRIQSGNVALQGVYAAEEKRLLDWTLDGEGPIPPPGTDPVKTSGSDGSGRP